MQKDINTATKEELVEVPTISPSRAASIIDWRESHGTVTDMSELSEIPGVGPKTVQRVAEHFSVGPTRPSDEPQPQPDEDEDEDEDEDGEDEDEAAGEAGDGDDDGDPDEGDEPDEAA